VSDTSRDRRCNFLSEYQKRGIRKRVSTDREKPTGKEQHSLEKEHHSKKSSDTEIEAGREYVW
jgi:hypothetical protein